MGVEDWENKYKVPDSGVLDDYLDAEQKLWEDEDKSIIYRISDNPCESKGSRFYQTVECDALSPEEMEDKPRRQRHGFGSEVRLVYKEAGSFEDETSPPEIDIIPSVKELRQQSDREGLLYKTRLWAKTALEDTLESYAAFREEEAAREEAARIRWRGEYGSVGSDEMQYSFGSEEELEDLTFTEGDASYEYESYYYPSNFSQSLVLKRLTKNQCSKDLPNKEDSSLVFLELGAKILLLQTQASLRKTNSRAAHLGTNLISKWATDKTYNSKTKSLHNSPPVVQEGCSLDYLTKLRIQATHSLQQGVNQGNRHKEQGLGRPSNLLINKEASFLDYFQQVLPLQHSSSHRLVIQTSSNPNKVTDSLCGDKTRYLHNPLPLHQSHSRVNSHLNPVSKEDSCLVCLVRHNLNSSNSLPKQQVLNIQQLNSPVKVEAYFQQGLWWPAEAGDCGYYVYTDEEYIYSLLTDRAGRHLYACAAPEDVQALGNITENIANFLKQEKDKVTLCGFKIPLCTEDKSFWIPGQQHNRLALSDAPMDLTAALRKGEKIMNMNLESFSQMFQESISSQVDQPVDFSVYKLKKIKMDSVPNSYSYKEEPMEAADLTLKSLKGGRGGPYWKNQGIKDVFTPSPAPSPRHCSTQISPNRHYPIPEIRIAHVGDTSADQPKQKSSSMFSTVRGITGTTPITDASRADRQSSSTPAISPSVSSKVSETSKISRNLPETPPASKIPGLVSLGRKLPTPPTLNKATSALSAQTTSVRSLPTTSASAVAVPSVSPQRPQLARQPSQADKPRVLSQANKTTVTGMSDISKVSSTSAVDQTPSMPPKESQHSSREITPQLHILNDTSVTYNDAHLYKRNPNFGIPNDPQMGIKVLDFSATVNKNKNSKEKDSGIN
ncbi:uncharacterized protein LOC144464326 [Epinephelus lanceolatus]